MSIPYEDGMVKFATLAIQSPKFSPAVTFRETAGGAIQMEVCKWIRFDEGSKTEVRGKVVAFIRREELAALAQLFPVRHETRRPQ